jgi:PqqA peptide cyclase
LHPSSEDVGKCVCAVEKSLGLRWSGLKSSVDMVSLFLAVWRARYLRAKIRQVPFVYIDIADRCNSRCQTCDIWKIREGSPPEMTTKEILSLRPALRQLRTRIVSIGGGEPVLREDLETCIAGFRDIGLSVHMNSNGLLIDEKRAQSLADAGLGVIYFSCDHPDAEGYRAIRGVDGFGQLYAAIRHFGSLPRPVPVGLNMVVSSLNQGAIERMAERAIEWGVRKLQFIPVHTHLQHRDMDPEVLRPLIPKSEDIPAIKATLLRVTHRLRSLGIETNSEYFVRRFDAAYQAVRTVPCLAGTLFVMINPFGQVMPCYQHRSVCNIRQKSLDLIVRSEEFTKQRRVVAGCCDACWDTGSAEPNIRFHLPYLLSHSLEIYRQARMHLG